MHLKNCTTSIARGVADGVSQRPIHALYAVGGAAPIPLDTLALAMGGWHVLIGLGEGAITGLAVASVVAARPDLVYGARGRLPRLELRTPEVVG